jgi:hypothetical protein
MQILFFVIEDLILVIQFRSKKARKESKYLFIMIHFVNRWFYNRILYTIM